MVMESFAELVVKSIENEGVKSSKIKVTWQRLR